MTQEDTIYANYLLEEENFHIIPTITFYFMIQEELRVVRDVSEAAKKIEELHQTIIKCNEELRDLKVHCTVTIRTLYIIAGFQKVKTEVEDDLNMLKLKCEAEQTNHNSVKVYTNVHVHVFFINAVSS